MSTISKLKKNRKQRLNTLSEEAKKSSENQGGGGRDERFWSPTFDKDKGKGAARIRFIPAPDGEDFPWCKLFQHFFKGPTGKMYVENCLSTLGKEDPCNQLNSRLWNSGIESDKDVARKQKRNIRYISNVYVISDPANPENNGKVFLYQYGQTLFDKIKAAMNPDNDGVTAKEPIDPFDFWDGSDFIIQIKDKGGWNNYDDSYFDTPSALFDGDEEKLQEIWDKTYSIEQFTSEDNFKDYDTLRKRLYEVLGATAGSGVETVEGWNKSPSGGSTSNKKSEKSDDSSSEGIDDVLNNEVDEEDEEKMFSGESKKDSSTDDDDDDDLGFLDDDDLD